VPLRRRVFVLLVRSAKYLGPWLVAGVIFYFLFRRYPPAQVFQAAKGMNVGFFLAFSAVYLLYMWVFDCLSLAAIFTKFGVPSRAKDFWALRFASYAVMVLNYGASQGFLAYALKRRKHASLSKAGGLLALVAFLDVYWTVSIACGVSWFGPLLVRGVDLAPTLRLVWCVVTLCFGFLVFALKSPVTARLLPKMLAHDLLNAFPRAPLRKYASAFLDRFPMHVALNTSLFFAALAFGVHIPIREVLAKFPVVSAVATIPVTPGGLGTAQAAVVELFQDAARPEVLLSISLLFAFTNMALKAVLGLFFFRKAVA